jgi:hypothetical protein
MDASVVTPAPHRLAIPEPEPERDAVRVRADSPRSAGGRIDGEHGAVEADRDQRLAAEAGQVGQPVDVTVEVGDQLARRRLPVDGVKARARDPDHGPALVDRDVGDPIGAAFERERADERAERSSGSMR